MTSDPAGRSQTPDWLAAALAIEPETGTVAVDGTDIAFRAWGPPGEGVVLVHGSAAHARWWDHLGPLLVGHERRRVVALDLSGHGDSGHRPAYALARWAHEVVRVAEGAGLAERPIVLGHSMGGLVALLAARDFGERLGGVVAIDSPLRSAAAEAQAHHRRLAFVPPRVYRDRAQAVRHFRTVPRQDGEPAVLAHIAEHSVRAVDGGWSWKFDPRVFARDGLTLGELGRPACRVALFRAEHGLVPPAMAERMRDRLGGGVPVIEIPAAAHHVMIDSPLDLVSGLRTLLGGWNPGSAASAEAG